MANLCEACTSRFREAATTKECQMKRASSKNPFPEDVLQELREEKYRYYKEGLGMSDEKAAVWADQSVAVLREETLNNLVSP